MKKILVVVLSIIAIIGVYFLVTYINNEISHKKWQAEWEEKKKQEKFALEERYKKYSTLSEIQDKYYHLEDNLTTEMIIKNNPKKEYLDNLIGKNIFLFIQVNDIKKINEKRIIFTDERTRKRAALGLDFVIYDDNEKVNDISIYDKIDIEVIIEKVNIEENTLGVSKSPISKATLYLSVINMEKNWGNFDRSSNSNLDQRL